jgi:rhodanese-related sulfurtransferase
LNHLQELSPQEVQHNAKNYILIDVRREEEWEQTGIIEGAICLTFFDMFGNCDVLSWLKALEKHVTTKQQEIVLICAHANRTRTIGNYLLHEAHYENIFHLEGGMQKWLQEGKETTLV